MRKTITIVTVCLNSAETVRRTIESVISQKSRSVEYIVVDGGSTDGTCDIIASYGDAIDRFVSEPDRGIADAFNKGIALAKGSIIGLLNSDDLLLPRTLERVGKWFEQEPEADVLHGDVLLYEGDRFLKQLQPAGRWWYPWRLVIFNHPATFVRSELYQRLGSYDLAYRLAMDVEIWARWIRGGAQLRYLAEPLVRMQTGGASGRRPLEGYAEARRALVLHGFSPAAAYLQYCCRFAAQLLVGIGVAVRRVER